jgi:hypothetical protein
MFLTLREVLPAHGVARLPVYCIFHVLFMQALCQRRLAHELLDFDATGWRPVKALTGFSARGIYYRVERGKPERGMEVRQAMLDPQRRSGDSMRNGLPQILKMSFHANSPCLTGVAGHTAKASN